MIRWYHFLFFFLIGITQNLASQTLVKGLKYGVDNYSLLLSKDPPMGNSIQRVFHRRLKDGIQSREFLMKELHYSKNLLDSVKRFGRGETCRSIYTLSYFEDGRIKRSSTAYKGKTTGNTYWKYDSSKRKSMILTSDYNEKVFKNKISFSYNSHDSLILEKSSYLKGGEYFTANVDSFSYSINQNLKIKTRFSFLHKKRTLMRKSIKYFDINGSLTKEEDFDGDGSYIGSYHTINSRGSMTILGYDSSGNIISRRIENYDPSGNISEEIYDGGFGDYGKKVLYRYSHTDSSIIVQVFIFDADNTPEEYTSNLNKEYQIKYTFELNKEYQIMCIKYELLKTNSGWIRRFEYH